jgi:hypothetical protein
VGAFGTEPPALWLAVGPAGSLRFLHENWVGDVRRPREHNQLVALLVRRPTTEDVVAGHIIFQIISPVSPIGQMPGVRGTASLRLQGVRSTFPEVPRPASAT